MIIGTRVLGSHLMVGSVEPMIIGDCIDMEEGEASCYHKENGGDIDPDIALSYIDEKIERFLGHFQKDFEGGVSAEKLGAKYGGYGSFLPTYERAPSILPHNINQQSDCNAAAPTPVNVPLENPKAPPPKRSEAIVCNAISSHNKGTASGRVDSCLPATRVTNSYPSKDEATGRLGSPMSNRSLKFRLKVGSDSTALKNAAIYSGLGLDDSPLSSSENSSDVSEGMLPISQSSPDESPTKIIQAMTSFPVPHGALISPLHDSLLGLSRKEKPLRETKPVLSLEDKKDGLAKLASGTILKQNDSTLVKKKKKETGHKERQVNPKNEVYASRCEEKTTLTLVNGKSENEAFVSKDLLSNELQCKPGSEVTKSNAYLDPQKKKLSRKPKLHETDKDKASIKKEKPGIVGEKNLKVIQTAGGKIAGSFEEGFKNRSEAFKGRKDTDSDTPESENRKHRLKLHSNEKVGTNNGDSFNRTGLDENRKSKDVIERASGDLRRLDGLYDSGIKLSKSLKVIEPAAGVAPVDEWVCCDICQKWRLLPFGTKPDQLPDKWLCSMLNWLPGMNRCDISEQETTEKLYALYQLPLPESGNALQSHGNGLIAGDTSNEGKRKEIQNPVSRNGPTLAKSSLKDPLLESRKKRSLYGSSNVPNQLKNSTDRSSSDLHNSVEGKNRGKLKEKSTEKANCDVLKRKNKRPEGVRSVDSHQDFNMELGKLGCSSNSGLTNMEGGEGMLKKHNKSNTENKMQISLKKRGETAEITKKRKVKDWQDDQNSHNSALLHEPVRSKEESCERSKKKKRFDRVEQISHDKDNKPKMQNKKNFAKQTSVGKELLKRNLVARQVSAAGNSSSSNVSQSHLTKAKFGVKVSPAESVSSSPMRTSGLDQFQGEKEEITSNIHTDSRKVTPAFDVGVKDTALDTNSKKIKASSVVQRHVVNAVKDPRLSKPSNKKRKKENIHIAGEGLEAPQKQKGHDAEDQRSGALLQSNKAVKLQTKLSRDSEAQNKGGPRTVETRDGKSKCSSSGGECKEPSRLGGDPLRVSIRAGDSHQLITDASKSGDAVELKTIKNELNHGYQKPDLPGSRDVNASNLDRTKFSNQTACNTLKEAKKLRDSADHFKSSGFTFESNELYFQSALKYLHGAFLLETLNNTSGKPGDVSPMQFYGITAELCEICALEYERRQEMAAAALAFKCIEVAYLRIVYHRHSSVDGDRLEMHSLFRTIVQGESPSSSISDVDNLSNQGAMDKATFDKGSSRGAGSHIWNAANSASFARVLDFARDMNSAMEASRKSRNAFVAATTTSSCGSEGKHVDYVIESIKKVIDFSFQEVEELVQLVRVATQIITRSGFRSGRE
ncbi:uncharacterized protein LOC111460215 isoform X1 [Cucurbita moschata]|uniref:Uncharacterized protein LOC111460215 isoform X1 n=1 Tax=Cucurbita moschata TaxID=3662 RepID=A0A6J1H733_CUCMO|nr:uncharacterized protein LOC111460215 isoform X1 [Cucurbita moschata]XP_022959125.1 uncharacterized protein LOC111460215 isoform X1 [Cucurbita moschata]XP_022959126.1 uncharacterized protein LOC111460215 isoform X1 [Cucurbita moschata]